MSQSSGHSKAVSRSIVSRHTKINKKIGSWIDSSELKVKVRWSLQRTILWSSHFGLVCNLKGIVDLNKLPSNKLTIYSDIVAELPCPHSGILTYEDDMPGPNLQAASDIDGFDPFIIESYSAQLFLRKHLNQLHNMFYKPENGNVPKQYH